MQCMQAPMRTRAHAPSGVMWLYARFISATQSGTYLSNSSDSHLTGTEGSWVWGAMWRRGGGVGWQAVCGVGLQPSCRQQRARRQACTALADWEVSTSVSAGPP